MLAMLCANLVTGAAALAGPRLTPPVDTSRIPSVPAARSSLPRRALLSQALAATTAATTALTSGTQAAHASFEGAEWPLWPALPIAPYSKRKTVRNEAVPGRVWTFDQLLGIFYVHVPIRMTVIRMDGGGLFVYAPVAPTKECLALLQPLIDAHGPVKYIVLPSVAPEHKVLAGPFARQFSKAEFWTTDAQYSFPANLPATWLGFPGKVRRLPSEPRYVGKSRDGGVAAGGAAPPDFSSFFGGEFEFAVLSAKASKESIYQDAAFYHKPSKTVLLCDAVVSISAKPPDILLAEKDYTRALLYHARDDPLEIVEDTPANREKGWQRIALFGNFFMPGSLRMLDNDYWLRAAGKSPMPELGWGGVLPFTWTDRTPLAFDKFTAGGKPLVAPIIQIILSRQRSAAKAWADTVCGWDFDTVLPAHFDSPIRTTGPKLREAFAFLDTGRNDVRYCSEDAFFLNDALQSLEATPDLALFDTPLGPLNGADCGLGSPLDAKTPVAGKYTL